MFHPATYIFLTFALMLFFVVRQFLRKWGLDGSSQSGDYGLGKVFYYAAFFFLWACPCLFVWFLADIVRQL